MTLRINRVGGSIADKNDAYMSRFRDIDRRLAKAEDEFEHIVEQLMEAPPGINLSGLNILGGGGMMSTPTPGTPASAPAASPGGEMATPQMPAMEATTMSDPSLAGPTPPIGGPNLTTAPATMEAAGPNLSVSPTPPAGGPDLTSTPAATAATGPNLSASPTPPAGPSTGAVPSGTAQDMSATGIQSALANLKAAPQQEVDPVYTGGGAMGFDPAAALKALKKAPQREEKTKSSGPYGFDPKAALAGLKKAPGKEEEEGISPEVQKSEFASILDKRKKETEQKEETDEDKIEEPEELSAEDMKSQLQARLKAAFKK
ncbi:MAG: hypothetical protein ACW98K_18440 [Candidatus Kariarchaeaceae archaeon]